LIWKSNKHSPVDGEAQGAGADVHHNFDPSKSQRSAGSSIEEAVGCGCWRLGAQHFCPSRGGPGCFGAHPFGHRSSDHRIIGSDGDAPSLNQCSRIKTSQARQAGVDQSVLIRHEERRGWNCIDRDVETEEQKPKRKGGSIKFNQEET
jgi:hypothetical protein